MSKTETAGRTAGKPKTAPKAAAKPTAKAVAKKPAAASAVETLHGSSVLASTFVIGGETVQLGTIVAAAHTASGLSAADWNALPDMQRDGLLQAEVDRRVAAAPPQPDVMPAPTRRGAPSEPVYRVEAILPEELTKLIADFAEALRGLAAAQLAVEAAQTPEDKTAAEPARNEASDQVAVASAAIDAFIADLVRGKLATAEEEAERQLADKREELRLALDAAGTAIATAQGQAAAASPTKSTDTPQSDDQHGSGNGAAPATGVKATVLVKVTGPKQGRWRAGKRWTEETREAPVTEDQYELLIADPKLKVERLN